MTKKKTIKKRLFKVLVLENTFVEGNFRTKGDEVSVSKDYYDRVMLEKDQQLQIL